MNQVIPMHHSISLAKSSEKAENLGGNILDLSMSTRTPSRSSSTASPGMMFEVCYTCGQESKALTYVFVKFVRNCPSFPNLTVQKPPRAKSIDSEGRIRVCSHCHLSLIQQWDFYQKAKYSTSRAYI
ncbi:uncharacterized protein CEXT_640631 [Caerostris extrusa]|uniref:Uncharacterized protein n=1 Tax=Caerostris extrusa TaxID=172846 RepID=A0AAV4TPH6_CAEEX|nr:uncharacterized protein CEXT_640631 [Caerostris extrusa]